MSETQQENSQFTARADNAALQLRQDLLKQGRSLPESGAVQVGPNGQPPPPLPPSGSYMRQAIETQQRQQAVVQQDAANQPPAQPPQQQVNGQVTQPPIGGQQPQQEQPTQAAPQPEQEISANAQERIRELVNQLRTRDQEFQQAQTRVEQASKGNEELQQRLQALEQQHRQMLEANLENLDPETRMAVMQDARLQQQLAQFEQQILSKISPAISSLQQQSVQAELSRLASRYVNFDYNVHVPLMEMFRKQNQNCSLEQAYRAIVEDPRELAMRSQAPANAVPPVVPPGNGPTARYMNPDQSQQQRKSIDEEIREEAMQMAKLRASSDPADQKRGMQLAHQNIARRLGF